jgi:hypothetical protein
VAWPARPLPAYWTGFGPPSGFGPPFGFVLGTAPVGLTVAVLLRGSWAVLAAFSRRFLA